MMMRPDAFGFRAAYFVYFDDMARTAAIFNASTGVIAAEHKQHGTCNDTQHQLLQHI